MANLRVIIHPTCYSSYRLVKYFMDKSISEKVELVVGMYPSVAFKYRAWSVPWVTVDDKPVAADPIEPGELETIALGQVMSLSKSPIEAFEDTVLHSVFASSQLALWRSLDPLLDRDFVSVAVRSALTGIETDYVLMELRNRSQEILNGLIDKTTRALAVSFTREAWWAHSGELTSEQLLSIASPGVVATWLIAKSSIGRIGLPGNPTGRALETARKISDFISKNSKGILSKIEREQREILEDEEYWVYLSRLKHD